MASCVKYGLEIKHATFHLNIENQLNKSKKKLEDIDYMNFQKEFNHAHEPVNLLKKKYGYDFDVISVKRNKYERFFSLWKHILHEMDLKDSKDTYKKCRNLNIDELLFYKDYNLIDDDVIEDIVNTFVKKYNLKHITQYGKNMLSILIRPYSVYHLNDANIIWFDFDKLNELEDCVSAKLNIDFKLVKINSSNQYNPNFKNDEYFKEKFDCIYSKYEIFKENKTLI
jgi:hypothetical protein